MRGREFEEHVLGGHDESCVSCLEDDNECMVYVYASQ